jgi:hypothetical protein
MNSTLKVALLVLGIVLLVGAIFSYEGWHFSTTQSATPNELGSSDTSATADKTSNDSSGAGTKTGGSSGTGATTKVSNELSDATLFAVISNTLIRVPQTGVDVALTNGQADFVDSSTKGHVSISRVLTKVPTDSGYDVFVDMTVTIQGRPQVEHYVALFHNLGQSALFTSSALIGDRLTLTGAVAVPDKSVMLKNPQSFMTSSLGYTLNVSYLDRKVGEPFTTAPTVLRSISLHVKNHSVSR